MAHFPAFPPQTLPQDSSGQSLPSLMASAVVREHTGRQDTAGASTGWSQLGPQCVERQVSWLSKSSLWQEVLQPILAPKSPILTLQLLARVSSVSCNHLTLSGQEWGGLGHKWISAAPA